ncbi:hypothetical protein [Nocardioides sp. B-3]|uniref:hypothetical protein n=1 Tax=Nocardioides sp. B-3 TaxID=2895565 RepID=UPI0021538508|nr:hypothetical protein [Nocardioides sp. B-3]UUZ61432.1 hypothetical protein LP418_13170 [Nocardioides sp. B-3]
MNRSLASTPRLAGLAALALSAATPAMPMTSVAPANAVQDEPSSLRAANDKAAQWIARARGQGQAGRGRQTRPLSHLPGRQRHGLRRL